MNLQSWFSNIAEHYGGSDAIHTADGQKLTFSRLNQAGDQIAATLLENNAQSGSNCYSSIQHFGLNFAFWLAVWRIGANLLAQKDPAPFLKAGIGIDIGMRPEGAKLPDDHTCFHFDGTVLKADVVPIQTNPPGSIFVPTINTTRETRVLAYSHAQILSDAKRYADLLGPCSGPIFTTTSLDSPRALRDIVRAFNCGQSVIGPDAFSDDIWSKITHLGVAELFITPLYLHRLLNSENRPTKAPNITRVFIGSGTPQVELLRKAYDYFGDVIELAAGTPETSVYAFKKYDPSSHTFGQIGPPQNGSEARILDGHGQTLPAGQIGRLALHVPNKQRYEGYVNSKEAYDDGWVYPGFLASMDETGNMTKHGRTDDRLSLGGTRYFAGMIEDSLVKLPNIAELCALKVLDETGAEALGLLVLPKPKFDKGLLANLAKRSLKGIGAVLVKTTEALPTLPNGQVNRRAARQMWDEL